MALEARRRGEMERGKMDATEVSWSEVNLSRVPVSPGPREQLCDFCVRLTSSADAKEPRLSPLSPRFLPHSASFPFFRMFACVFTSLRARKLFIEHGTRNADSRLGVGRSSRFVGAAVVLRKSSKVGVVVPNPAITPGTARSQESTRPLRSRRERQTSDAEA